MIVPTLQTARLTLREPRLADFEHWAAFFATPRSAHEGGPLTRTEAWRHWASDVAGWALRGYGPFGVEDRATGAYLGEVGIYHGDHFPEPELGWFVLPEAEGKGYAAEAAQAVKDWARREKGWSRLVSIIDPANLRSIATAERIGGFIDPTLPGVDPDDVVVRHDLGPSPAERPAQ